MGVCDSIYDKKLGFCVNGQDWERIPTFLCYVNANNNGTNNCISLNLRCPVTV